MFRPSMFVAVAFPAILFCADPEWAAKPLSQWTDQDAKAVLAGSGWVKKTQPVETLKRNEVEMRNSGLMGTSEGIDLSALSPASLFAGTNSQGSARHRLKNAPPSFEVRWESGLPVRAAELKVHEDDPPDWKGDYYAIAIYDVPEMEGNAKALLAKLRREAFLKRANKPDLRPAEVQLLPQVGGRTTVLYLFSRAQQITLADQRVEFSAILGRVALAQFFYTAEMQFQGKLAL